MTSITRSKLRGGLAGLLAIAIPLALAAQGNLQPIKDIRERGELRVAALKAGVYPFYFQKDGAWAGFDIQLAARIAKTIGVKLSWDAAYATEAELIAAIHDRKADIALSRLKRDTDDAQAIGYTKPYVTLGYVLLTNRMRVAAMHPADESLATLTRTSLKLGTLGHPGYQAMAARKFPAAAIQAFPDMGALAAALVSGGIDAAFCDAAEARFNLDQNPELGILIAYYPLPELKSGIVAMVDWSDKQLAAWLNIFIDPISKSTSFENLLAIQY
jgi:ABC-type amino acid transport substrate-binding protein